MVWEKGSGLGGRCRLLRQLAVDAEEGLRDQDNPKADHDSVEAIERRVIRFQIFPEEDEVEGKHGSIEQPVQG